MKQIIKSGTTSKRLVIFIQNSSLTTGAGLTGLTNASSGLKWYYYREDSTVATSISIVGETLGTWTSGGFKEIDSTNLPGFYEIGVPNAVLAATNSPTWAVMGLQGAANMVPVNIEIQLVGYDPTSSTLGISFPTNFSSLVIDVSGRVDVSKWLGTAVTAATGGIPDVNVKNYNNHAALTDANNMPEVDVEDWRGSTARFTAAGFPDINVLKWNGTNVAAPNIGGVPLVDVADFGGTAVVMSTGTPGLPTVTVGTNLDKTGYALTQTFPTNFSSLAITAGGAVTLNPGQITVKKNQALAGFTFPMYSSTTGSLVTGLTVVSQRSIDGGGITTTTNNVVEVGSGIYKLDLSAADLNGNSITLVLTASGAFDAVVTFVTQP